MNSTLLRFSLRRGLGLERDFHRWVAPTLKVLRKRKEDMGPQPPSRRNTFLEWNYNAELFAFSKRIGEQFEPNLLRQALIETSYIEQQAKKQKDVGIEPDITLKDNRELAVLGQELIESYVLQYLVTSLPRLPKKYVAAIKESLTTDELLGDISKNLGLSDLVLCEEYPDDPTLLARVFKSIVGALAGSVGHDRACAFVRDLVVVHLAGEDLTKFCTPIDPLAELDAILAEEKRPPAEPRLISAIGRHTILASYDVGVYSDKKMIGRGYGESAETAQNMAACDALWRIWDVTPSRKPFRFNLELPPVEKMRIS